MKGPGFPRPPRRNPLGSLNELAGFYYDLGVDLELDRVAGDGHGAGQTVPVQTEVEPVDLTLQRDADALLRSAERVGAAALDGGDEGDRPGDIPDGEVAKDPVGVAFERLDASDLVGHVGVLRGVEEVG